MLHFFDMLHIKVLTGGLVVLSVRVSDTRVDEYRFDVGVFRQMVAASHTAPSCWTGPEDLLLKMDTEKRLASLSIAVGGGKREVYRFGQSQFDALTAQFRAQDVS